VQCSLGGTGCEFQLCSRRQSTDRTSYVWGDTVAKAKTQCESLDYLFQLAVEMYKLGLPWLKEWNTHSHRERSRLCTMLWRDTYGWNAMCMHRPAYHSASRCACSLTLPLPKHDLSRSIMTCSSALCKGHLKKTKTATQPTISEIEHHIFDTKDISESICPLWQLLKAVLYSFTSTIARPLMSTCVPTVVSSRRTSKRTLFSLQDCPRAEARFSASCCH